jgi:putative MATE family efflux protein
VHSEPLQKSLWSLSWPMLVSLAMTLSLFVTDSLFLSRESDAAAAAVGALFPVLTLTNAVSSSMGLAGCAVAGQLLGARQHRRVPATYTALLLLNGALGLVFGAVFLLLQGAFPAWLGMEGPMLGHAQTYIAWIGGTQILTGLQHALLNILNSRGATRWALVHAVVINLSNIGLNVLFLSGPWGSLGVEGVAWATIVSKALGLALAAFVVVRYLKVELAASLLFQELREAIGPILRIGLPSSLEPISFEGSQIALTMIVVTMGSAALAARVYTFNLCILGVVWSIGLGVGTQILLAHRIGERSFARAEQQLYESLRLAISGGVVLVAVLNVLRVSLVRLFTDDAEILTLTEPLFLLAFPLEVGRATNVVVGGALRASGDARFVSVLGTLLMWLFAVPLCYVLGIVLELGVVGVWLGMAIDECVRGIVNFLRFRSGAWRAFGVVQSA